MKKFFVPARVPAHVPVFPLRVPAKEKNVPAPMASLRHVPAVPAVPAEK